eukprot:519418_1
MIMINKLLLLLSVWIPFCTSTYDYYFIETENEQHLNGWYHRIAIDELPVTIRTQRDPKSVYRQYHHDNINYFLFSPVRGPDHNYKWMLMTSYPHGSYGVKLQHSGHCSELNQSIVHGTIQAMYVKLPAGWKEPHTNSQNSRAPWKHKFEYITSIVHLLHQQEEALQQSPNDISGETIKNLTEQYKLLEIQNQELVKNLKHFQKLINASTIKAEVNENLMAENERLQENINIFGSVVIMLVILIILFICAVLIALWRCHEQTVKMQKLQVMQRYENKPIERSNALSRRKLPCKQVNLIKNETVGRWAPEQFSDMLGNSQAIQDMIVGDIINDMQTEGDNNVDAKNEEHHRDSVIDDGTITRFEELVINGNKV